jgi:phenylpropionate dioxygenase-like ring-hydroxylating dioxygenase large terminal subunit
MNVQKSSFNPAPIPNIGTDPVPAKAYYDPEYYALEIEAVFKNTWLVIGHVCEIPEPGNFIRRELEFAKASLLITRGKDGSVHAMHNACTHRGTQLTQEVCGKKNTFSCPYHMWTFGTDGKLISAPEFERFYVGKDELGLHQVNVEVCAGLIFINLAKNPEQTLREFLGPLGDQLETMPIARATTFSEYVYDIDANWKITYDNFQENYHLRFIHPKTGSPSYSKDNPFGYPLKQELHDPHRTQTIWTNPDAAIPDTLMMASKRGVPRGMADGLFDNAHTRDYFALFPTFFLLGSPLNQFSHTVYPLGPNKSRGVIRLWWVGEDETASVRFSREFTAATTRDVHSEDVAVIEAGQRGLDSGALEFVHFMDEEVLCRHLYQMVDQRVQAYKEKLKGQ